MWVTEDAWSTNKYLVYFWPLRPAANIQVHGPTKFAYLLVVSTWTSFRRSCESLQPFSLLSNPAHCFAVARSVYSNSHFLGKIETASHFLSTCRFPKMLGKVTRFVSIRRLSQKIERFFSFSVYLSLLVWARKIISFSAESLYSQKVARASCVHCTVSRTADTCFQYKSTD
jgi:hypothetical protein